MEAANIKSDWVHCPICGSKTRDRIREDTVLKNYPLYCPKCKQETLIVAKNLQVTVIKGIETMAVLNIRASFKCDVKKVWDTVTSLDKYQWRSDLSKIEVLSDTQFVEYTKDGFATTFTITVSEKYQRWEFDIENSNMSGHWIGIFIAKDDQTEVDFIENMVAKKLFMKPFVKTFLKKQQKQYVSDLKKALRR